MTINPSNVCTSNLPEVIQQPSWNKPSCEKDYMEMSEAAPMEFNLYPVWCINIINPSIPANTLT